MARPLDFRRAAVLRPGSGVARAPRPKRRGASLPAALQNVRGLPHEPAQFRSWLGGRLTQTAFQRWVSYRTGTRPEGMVEGDGRSVQPSL
jgi:hypothetical protein